MDRYGALGKKRKTRTQESSMEDPGNNHSNRRQRILDEEERLRVYAIRLAIVDRLTRRIGAVAVAWATGVIVGAFGFILTETEFWLLSLITFVEAPQRFFRGHELELQAISSEPRDSGIDSPTLRSRLLSTLGNWLPRVLRVICVAIQIVFALGRFSVSTWRLVSVHHFCDRSFGPGYKGCQASVYLFYALTILGAALFLLHRVFFEYHLIRLKRPDTQLDSPVFRKFYTSVYAKCLEGNVLDGFDINLVVLGVQWLEFDKMESQLCGAKLLHELILAGIDKNNDKQSQTADALRRLGTCPGLLERFAEILFLNSDKRELVNEIVAIVCHVVTSDRIVRSRFEAVPRALDTVEELRNAPADNTVGASRGESRTDELDGQDVELAPNTCQQVRHTLERALRQYIEDVVLIPDFLRDTSKDD